MPGGSGRSGGAARTTVRVRFGLCAVLLAASSATQRSAELPDISGWDRRTDVLGRLDEFEFSGRVGVSYADDGFNGKLRWQQSGSAYDARLSGPLGVGTV